ncbi:hypothetical protein H4I95_09899 [Botrytis cinerea]
MPPPPSQPPPPPHPHNPTILHLKHHLDQIPRPPQSHLLRPRRVLGKSVEERVRNRVTLRSRRCSSHVLAGSDCADDEFFKRS